jgi:hypothetical protein
MRDRRLIFLTRCPILINLPKKPSPPPCLQGGAGGGSSSYFNLRPHRQHRKYLLYKNILCADASFGPVLVLVDRELFVRPGAVDADRPADACVLRDLPFCFPFIESLVALRSGIIDGEEAVPFFVFAFHGYMENAFGGFAVALHHFIAEVFVTEDNGITNDPFAGRIVDMHFVFAFENKNAVRIFGCRDERVCFRFFERAARERNHAHQRQVKRCLHFPERDIRSRDHKFSKRDVSGMNHKAQ